MLATYCRHCPDDDRYRDVWSSHVARTPNSVAVAAPTPPLGNASTSSPSSEAGPVVRMATYGMNGASVCAFARHAKVHVSRW